jgi:hypothetical protein
MKYVCTLCGKTFAEQPPDHQKVGKAVGSTQMYQLSRTEVHILVSVKAGKRKKLTATPAKENKDV